MFIHLLIEAGSIHPFIHWGFIHPFTHWVSNHPFPHWGQIYSSISPLRPDIFIHLLMEAGSINPLRPDLFIHFPTEAGWSIHPFIHWGRMIYSSIYLTWHIHPIKGQIYIPLTTHQSLVVHFWVSQCVYSTRVHLRFWSLLICSQPIQLNFLQVRIQHTILVHSPQIMGLYGTNILLQACKVGCYCRALYFIYSHGCHFSWQGLVMEKDHTHKKESTPEYNLSNRSSFPVQLLLVSNTLYILQSLKYLFSKCRYDI